MGGLSRCGVYNGYLLPYLERLLVGPHIILREDNFLRLRMFFCMCGYFITRADTDIT